MPKRTLVLMRHAKSDWSGNEPDLSTRSAARRTEPRGVSDVQKSPYAAAVALIGTPDRHFWSSDAPPTMSTFPVPC